MDSTDRFKTAMAGFDQANAQDPKREALFYAQRMSDWLARFAPGASESLRLAARSQHICRWMIPREKYPMTRAGYHRWRTEAAQFHAEKAGQILREAGYDEPTIACVQSLLRKENLTSDPETQTLENVACLVFLENYFSDFAQRHEEEKILTILRRTWAKMSPRGREAALHLPLRDRERALIQQAINPAHPGATEVS
jgi:hypothetical protein